MQKSLFPVAEKDIYPLRYAGGKSKHIQKIKPFFPKDIKKVISCFAGGCSVEIALANSGVEVIAYDIFEPLVLFWNTILHKNNELADVLETYIPTKEEYYKNRAKLLDWWNKRIELDNLELVALYYYNHQLSYGPMFLGWPSSVYLKDKVYKSIVKKVRKFRCPNLQVIQAGFQESIPKHRDDFLFLDPPYYLGEDSSVFKGIYPNSNFAIHHNGFLHGELKDLLIDHGGGFVITYNRCKTIEEWYKDYEYHFPKWNYTFQAGEKRIGKNRLESGINHVKKQSSEIIIVKR